MRPRREQFSGCLIGQALGDALGFVVEGFPPETCSEYVRMLRAGYAGGRGRGSYPFGQYTDDTQLARELLQTLVHRRRFVPEDYASRIAALFAEKRIVGRGRATEEAAARLAAGVPWSQAATPPPSAGNGSAMRAAPIGLAFFDAPHRMIRAAIDQGRITHADPRCSAGAVAIAGGVSLALRDGVVDTGAFLESLAGWVATVDASMASALLELRSIVAAPPDEAVAIVRGIGGDEGIDERWRGISPFVVPSVLWSLYSFLRSPRVYWETIYTAIAVGGDVDTTAAMAGALSGAHLGLQALPAGPASRLNDRGTWAYDELVQLAEILYRLKIGRGFGT